MAANISAFQITAPGFYGLNTEDSPVDLSPNFASVAYNCVIDKFGRVGSRMGWDALNTTNSDLGTNDITCIGELIGNDGTVTILAAGGGFFFTLSGTTLTTLTYDGGGTAPTISDNNWQFTQLNGIGVFFQRGYDPIAYNPANATNFRRVSELASYSGTILQANCGLSAFGRLWCADTSTDKNTIKWSDIITPQVWTTGSSGSLNMLGVWRSGGDEVVALAAHNNFLVIFGKRQIVIYSGADTPTATDFQIYDTIDNIGCISRDSVQNTGEDIIFLSSHGVMSLNRTIQEKSAPIFQISRNVRTDLQNFINSESLPNIKAIYSPIDAFYLITLPLTKFVYCFDLRHPLKDGSSRTTLWNNIEPKSFFYISSLRLIYLGKEGYVGKYNGYLDNADKYRLVYYTPWMDLGNKIQHSILKKFKTTVIGANDQPLVLKYGFDFVDVFRNVTSTLSNIVTSSKYGIAKYGIGKYSTGIYTSVINENIGGNGKVVKLGIETDINDNQVSIQQIELFTKDGKL